MDRGHKVLDPKEPVGDPTSVVRLSVKKGVKCSKPAFEMSLGLSYLRADVGLPVRRLEVLQFFVALARLKKSPRRDSKKAEIKILKPTTVQLEPASVMYKTFSHNPPPPACQQ